MLLNNQSTDHKTKTGDKKNKNRPIPIEIGLFVLVWLPFVNEVRTFLSTPSENYLMLSMLNDISFLNA
jgi:hypothetical protein